MILVDAIYINISGGKVLLDYLIKEFGKAEIDVYYIFDLRIKNKHPILQENRYRYLAPTFLNRHNFYLKNGQKFSKVLCFGNLPPSIKVPGIVYTYFHQPLYLNVPNAIPLLQRVKLLMKIFILSRIVRNTNYWIVQSEFIKVSLIKKFNLMNKPQEVKILPFYPDKWSSRGPIERNKRLIYISNGEKHKNHERLMQAFIQFYESHKQYELHLTVEKKFGSLYELISELQKEDYPIINHEYLDREKLGQLYRSSEYLIYPSLASKHWKMVVK